MLYNHAGVAWTTRGQQKKFSEESYDPHRREQMIFKRAIIHKTGYVKRRATFLAAT